MHKYVESVRSVRVINSNRHSDYSLQFTGKLQGQPQGYNTQNFKTRYMFMEFCQSL